MAFLGGLGPRSGTDATFPEEGTLSHLGRLGRGGVEYSKVWGQEYDAS